MPFSRDGSPRPRAIVEGLGTAVLILFVARGARAELILRLDIVVETDKCKHTKGDKVYLVMDENDNEGARKGLTWVEDPLHPCHWTYIAPKSFSTDLHFSLRLGDARTECHKALPEDDKSSTADKFKRFGRLSYPYYNNQEARRVIVKPPPDVPVSYVREVKDTVPGQPRVAQAVPCLEGGVIDPTKPIDHVQWKSETIHLQIGSEAPNREKVGLDLGSVRHRLREGKPLKFDDVIYGLAVQRAKNNGDLSPNAIELDVVNLSGVKFKEIPISVE